MTGRSWSIHMDIHKSHTDFVDRVEGGPYCRKSNVLNWEGETWSRIGFSSSAAIMKRHYWVSSRMRSRTSC